MSGDLDGLVAVVTGGASGIGFATASELRARGARVAVLDRAIDTIPEATLGVESDVTVRDSVDAAIGRVGSELGGIDILVNTWASARSARSKTPPTRSGRACSTSTS